MTEQCWSLIGGYDENKGSWYVQLAHHVSGEPASVEADWQRAMVREEDFGDLAGFAHTHPRGAGTKPSARDIQTMRAWCSALGKPLLCLIAEGDTLLEPFAYQFEDDQSDGTNTNSFRLLDY